MVVQKSHNAIITMVVLTAAILAVSASAAFAEVRYTVTDIGVGDARAINNSGQVVGSFGGYDIALYSGGQITNLGTVGTWGGHPYGLNDGGQVVGEAGPHGFLYSNNEMNAIGPWLGESQTIAFGINAAGQVVGETCKTRGWDNTWHAFLYSGGQVTDISTVGAIYSVAYSINAKGQVAGFEVLGYSGNNRAYVWQNGHRTSLGSGIARGINDAGQVVGTNALGHAVLWSGGVTTDLGSLSSTASTDAYDINNVGQIVGYSNNQSFLYENGQMLRISSLIDPHSGWIVEHVYGINDSGQIVGDGYNVVGYTGQSQALLLTPVPEPATLSLLGVGLIALLRRRSYNR